MRLDWKAGLGIVLSAVLLWWTLHDIDFAAVWGVLRASDGWLWSASTVAATLIFPVRARRWRTILDPVVPRLPFRPLWRATAVGMMVNNVAPARAGELARVVALRRERPDVPFGGALASLAVDRLFDAVVLLLLLFAAPLDPAFPAGARVGGYSVLSIGEGGVGLTVLLVVGLYAVVAAPDGFARVLAALARRVAPRWESRAAGSVRTFAAGLGVLRDPRRFAAVFAWSVAHWLLCAWSVWIGFRAVGIAAPFSAALFLNSLLSVASAIPASPGFFGLFESVSRVGLAVYGVPATRAVSWALGYHILTFVPITVFGFVYLARLGLTFGQLADRGDA
ncbi:TIGR00374 family protein [Gemmatimonadetes bacterium T265]|nr:TIGR00374 family protein [Gemmatimonadetes bacterium T265]